MFRQNETKMFSMDIFHFQKNMTILNSCTNVFARVAAARRQLSQKSYIGLPARGIKHFTGLWHKSPGYSWATARVSVKKKLAKSSLQGEEFQVSVAVAN